MSENNLNLYDVLKLSETEQSLVGEKIDRILERLFLNGPGQAGALDENIINGYTKKLCGAFKDPEARKGLLSVCRLLKELEDNHKSTVDIYSSLNGMNIDRFIKITKSFRLTTDHFFCVSSNTEEVDPKKTKPALAIANAEEIFNNKESKILKFRDNTCKIGFSYQEQWVCNLNGDNFGEKLRIAEHGLRRDQWRKAVEKQGYTEQNIRDKIGEDFRGHKSSHEFPNIKAHFLSRKLFPKGKAEVFNVPFCGRSDSDTVDIDSNEYNIFYMLNNGLQFNDQLRLYPTSYFENGEFKVIGRLFDEINCYGIKLNDLGLRITERVLKLFLPKDRYDVTVGKALVYDPITEHNVNQNIINVVNKGNKYSQASQAFAMNSASMENKNDKYKQLEELLKQLCINNFNGGLSDEVDNFKEKLNSIDIGNIIKCMNDMGMSLDKNDIVDMLSDILYQIEPLDIEYPKNPKTLKMDRETFACPSKWDELTVTPLDVIHIGILKWLDKKSIEPIKNLPSAFCSYSSTDEKKTFSPIHYIQALFAALLIIKKYYKAGINTKRRIALNINYLINALVDDDATSYEDIVNRVKYCQSIYELSSPQEAFAFMICNGTQFTTMHSNNGIPEGEKDDITNICEMAYTLTEFDLDNDTRQHVTQLNFVELLKNENGRTTAGKETGGLLVIPMNAKRLFQENEYGVDEDEKEWEWNYEEDNIENNENINNQSPKNNDASINQQQKDNNLNNADNLFALSGNNNDNNNKEANCDAHDLTPEEWINQATEQYQFTLDDELKGILKKHIIDNITQGEEDKKFPSKVYYNFYKPITDEMSGSKWLAGFGKEILEGLLEKSVEENKDGSNNNNQNPINNLNNDNNNLNNLNINDQNNLNLNNDNLNNLNNQNLDNDNLNNDNNSQDDNNLNNNNNQNLDNDNLNNEIKNKELPIDQQIIKSWMLESGCWDEGNGHEGIKSILTEYITKNKIDSIDKAKAHKELIALALGSYKENDSIDIANLRALLGLPKLEDKEEKPKEEKPEEEKSKEEKPKEEKKVISVDYQAIYNDIKNSGYFCCNMCVLKVKYPKVYEGIKQNCLDFSGWKSFKVAFYRIFVFWFTNKEFEGYTYDEQKYIKKGTEEKTETSDKPLNIVDENNKNKSPNIPLQETQNLSNDNKNENELGDKVIIS